MQNNAPRSSSKYRAAASQALEGNWLRTIGLILLAFVCSMALPVTVGYGFMIWLNSQPVFMRYSFLSSYLYIYMGVLVLSYFPALLFAPGWFSVLAQPYLGRKPQIRDVFVGFRRPLHTAGTLLLSILCWLLILLVCFLPAIVVMIAGRIWAASLTPLSTLFFIVYCVGYIVAISQMLYFAPVPLLIATHPTMGARETLRHSRQIMRGRRWPLVKLCLSHILWILLTILAVGLLAYLFNMFIDVYSFPILSIVLSIAILAVSLSIMLRLYSAVTGFLLHADGVDIFAIERQAESSDDANEC